MPRRTAKSRKNNVNTNTCHIPSTNAAISTPTKIQGTPSAVRKGRPIKQEKELDTATETVTEQVVHRKSERRRVARDIFLVFEEQPSSRRSGRTNKKHQTKPKFGHLKVEDPIKPKSLLRDIKNEPKCYLTSSSNSSITAAPKVVNNNIIQTEMCVLSEKKIDLKKTKSCTPKLPSASGNAKNKVDFLNVKTVGIEVNTKAASESLPLVARVNPIFLWIKQDDTRIVEVRCEDYDKRNRIRLTKTSNGWRAIPRSDPTSSKVLKFYPTPLMKVKREKNIVHHETNSNNSGILIGENKQSAAATNSDLLSQNTLKDVLVNNIGYELNGIDSVVCNPLATAKKTKKKKSSKRKKKSAHCRKTSKNSNVTATKKLFENIENSLSANNQSSVLNYIHNEHSTTDECEKSQHDCSNVTIACKRDKSSTENNGLSSSDFVNLPNDVLETNIKPLLIIPLAMRLSPLNEVAVTSEAAKCSESEHTYQKEMQDEFSFQLCPKTGLFLPNNRMLVPEDHLDGDERIQNQHMINLSRDTICLNHIQNSEQIVMDLDKVTEESKSQTMDDNTAESLEAKTKNLKDLLDDADLLQHCDDNANSDAELIDTLVKTSCENNLIQANEIVAKGTHIDHVQQKSLHNSTNDLVVQLITDVSDPPKCLSFNEAGEIEGLNGELFQANSYIESFEKQPSSALISNTQMPPLQSMSVVTSASSALSVPQQSMICGENIPILDVMDISNSSKLSVLSVIEDSPKDLSYKKREEVCPPSESRSQCAVTSSSDVVKSPQHDTFALASSSETLKNLILEQFMKLNALSTNKQKDPIDLGKKKQPDNSNSTMCSVLGLKPGTTSNFIETVVIDDDDDEELHNSELEGEPLKKRIRLNTTQSLNTNKGENGNVKAKMAMIDQDPDPLTQLRLLIQNTQWKVPDPILVPKDRLTAVLASPAREIPLLITTRPELRLPEAFAYPEIIQNPNILVISMAQLEAILQNEIELDKTSRSIDIGPIADIASPKQQTAVQRHQHQSLSKQRKILNSNNSIHEHNTDTLAAETTSTAKKDDSVKCSHIDSSLASDINTATMAVLNQMLWLPYFGQISHDIIKSLKNPLGLQQKCAANLIPFYSSQLNGLQNMEEVYKSNKISKQMTHMHQNEPSATNGLPNLRQQGCTTDELTLFQKIVQHQMHSVLQSNQLKSPDATQCTAATLTTSTPNPLQSSIETTSSHIESLSNLIEKKNQRNCVANDLYKTKNPSLASNAFSETGGSYNMNVSEKSYNLRSSVASRQPSESKQYSSNNQRQNADNKPRLTCKSLSNLLDPEHSYQHSFSSSSASSSNPFVSNEASDFLKGSNGMSAHTIDCKTIGRAEGREAVISSEGKMVPPPSTRSVCSISNNRMETFNEFSKQHKTKSCFGDNKASESSFGNIDASVLSTETNAPLWHPLFGSNSKSAYSSPWQWTTVTASGE